MDAQKTEEKKPTEEKPKNVVAPLDPEKEEAARAAFFPAWSQEYLNLIKARCCPPGIPNADFAMFIEQCRRAELDPIAAEADCVPRKVKITDAETGQVSEITRWVFQPREAGMLARADRFPDFKGIRAAAVYANDTFEIDEANGTVIHKSKPGSPDRGKLLGAWAVVHREGRVMPIEWLDVAGYAGTSPIWKAIPHTMMVKCARAAALRRAYPRTFSASFIAEEMENEALAPTTMTAPYATAHAKRITDGTEKNHQTVDAAPTTRTETVAAKVAEKAAQVAPAKPPEVASPVAQPITQSGRPAVFEEPKAPAPAKVEEKTGPVAAYGSKDRLLGKPLAKLNDAELAELEKVGREFLAQEGAAKHKHFKRVSDSFAEVKAEIAARVEEMKKGAEAEAAKNAGGGDVLPGFESIASQLPSGPANPPKDEEEDVPF